MIQESTEDRRRTLHLVGLFAALALGFSCLGLFGVQSQSVTLRGREIGVRIAVGARPNEIRDMVVREGLTLVVAGGVVGIVGAIAVGRWIESLLFQASASDLQVLLGTLALLALATLIAILPPALKASRTDPIRALRLH